MDVPVSQCVSATITVVPTSGGLAAEIRAIDLSREMDVCTFSQVYEAWLQYSVLLFRGQHLTDDDLITFSRNFGELDWAPVQVLNNPHHHKLFLHWLHSFRVEAFDPSEPFCCKYGN